MSDKPESSKTQLETLKADILEKLSAKLKPDPKPSPVLTKPVNIHVELNQKLLELLEEGTNESREKAKKLLVDRNALLVAGDANIDAVESLTQQSFAIQSLVEALSYPQIRLMWHLNEPLFQKDFLSELPEEIAYRIIAHLTTRDLMTCAGVSRAWRRLCEDDRTWRQECLERGYVKFDAPSFHFLGGWADNRADEQAGITICSHMDLQEAHQNRRERENAYGQCYERSSWKSLYLRKKRIISNWRSRAIQSSTVQEVDKGIFRLQVHSGRILTCFDDTTLRVWNVDDAQPAFTLTGHMGQILTFQVSDDGEYIVSSGFDETVRVWCGQTGAQLHVLQGHTDLIPCMSLHGTTLVSGSSDQTLRVWDIVDGKCLHILTGHLAEVRFVLFDGKQVVSSADGDDFNVKVWNAHTEECLYMLTGHTDIILSLLFESERDLVVSGSRDGTIRVWDVRRRTCIARLVFHQGSRLSSYFEMQFRGNILVSYYDSKLKVWDIRDGGSFTHRLQEANRRTSNVTSLQLLDHGLLVTGSMDGSVMLWDVDKGIFVRDLVRFASCGYGGYNWLLKVSETLLVGAFEARSERSTNLILIDFDAAYP